MDRRSKNAKMATKKKIELKACVCYFSLFLKEKCISLLFRTKCIENLIYSCFLFPSFHEHSLLLKLPRTGQLLKTSFFKKNKTACVIETMLMM